MIKAMKQALEALENERQTYEVTDPEAGAPYNILEAITSLRQAIKELESQEPDKHTMDIECTKCGAKQSGVLTVNTHPPQRTEQEPVQVSPLEFVEMVMEKEHLIGKPIFWAEWPNQEKNT